MMLTDMNIAWIIGAILIGAAIGWLSYSWAECVEEEADDFIRDGEPPKYKK